MNRKDTQGEYQTKLENISLTDGILNEPLVILEYLSELFPMIVYKTVQKVYSMARIKIREHPKFSDIGCNGVGNPNFAIDSTLAFRIPNSITTYRSGTFRRSRFVG